MNEQYIPENFKERVNKELESGEQVEWFGTPTPRYFSPRARATFLLGIVWTACAIFWTYGYAEQENAPAWALYWGFPLLLVGVALLSIPIWSYRKALKTVYIITDKRAITIEEGWSKSTRSYFPENLQDIYIKERKDGTGDIIIPCRVLLSLSVDKQDKEFGFLQIENPKEVERKLRKLAEQGT